jgi:hypothetical protein
VTATTTYPVTVTTTRPVTVATAHPVTAAATRPQSTGGSQPWTEADGSQPGSRYYGQASFGDRGSWFGGHSSRYGGWPGHGGPGLPGQGFGFGQGGFGRP